MMNHELRIFELLKQRIEFTFKEHCSTCQEPITEWKGQMIVLFQEDLSQKVGGYVSEKWFYTHLKTSHNEKLPRVDMLNFLAQYVGATNWDNFVELNKEVIEPPKALVELELKSTARKTAANLWLLVVGFFFVIGTMVLVSFFNKDQHYQFCIVDIDNGQAIDYKTIQAYWLKPHETPMPLKVDSLACIKVPMMQNESIQLKIQALYYKPVNITRKISANQQQELIQLKKDDYALMIHYFSTNNIEDWNKRREQLAMMLSDNAKIIQVHSETGSGMALYNKEEFIDKMTMPVKSLKNIELLETKYQGEQIIEIRFVVKHN